MFDKILVANRGEIAVRIMRACRELGIRSVAVYTPPDRQALHVRQADEALALDALPGGDQASFSPARAYLDQERILQAAQRSGAQAIHPGYGFLSENASFAQRVEDAGLAFIGPPPQAIHAMGDKAEARRRMIAAGVPVVPGYQGADDEPALAAAAAQIGFPVLVKAAAGGGGRGVRVVERPSELAESIASARREAQGAFGDDRLILERYIAHAHHVEFQVLGDRHGHLVHLFERECSIQRRYQKLIEESPSPPLTPELRTRMGAAALAAARAVGYHNAGTIEFILDPQTLEFFFLEMNTRLQVEHPVTELVTGLDLVHWQIRCAAGERLPFRQEELTQRGHAIECRLIAEDPAAGFMPAAGRLQRLIPPVGPGVRLDAGYASGDEVPIEYDSLLAKLIVAAEDRPAAIRRMQAALRDSVLLGLPTNVQFLQAVLDEPAFQEGSAHTTWIQERFAGWQAPDCSVPPEVLAAAALIQAGLAGNAGAAAAHTAPGSDRHSPWQAANGFRLGAGHSGAKEG